MRVIVYAPPVRGVARTGRAVAREVRAQGHEVTGTTDSPSLAHAAYESGEVDRIAGRQRHLFDLANQYTFTRTPWALAVDRPGRRSQAAAWLVPLLGFEWVRRHPGWATTAGLVSAAAFALLLLPDSQPRPTVQPPVPSSSASSPPGRSSPPTRPSPTRPPATGGRAGSVTTRAAVAGGEGAGEVAPPATSPSAARLPVTSTPPPASPSPSVDAACVLRLRLLGVDVRLCAHQP